MEQSNIIIMYEREHTKMPKFAKANKYANCLTVPRFGLALGSAIWKVSEDCVTWFGISTAVRLFRAEISG